MILPAIAKAVKRNGSKWFYSRLVLEMEVFVSDAFFLCCYEVRPQVGEKNDN